MPEPRWLEPDEQRAWRATFAGSILLVDQLDRDLRMAHDLTLADYEILVHLSESEAGKLRMAELADAALVSRSRLTHRVNRLSARKLVDREACHTDRRGTFAVLTRTGRGLLEQAARTHVESVRTHLVDRLSADEFAQLGGLLAKVAAPLMDSPSPTWDLVMEAAAAPAAG
jgi:DNA-binding MarR family transcriptional regulator